MKKAHYKNFKHYIPEEPPEDEEIENQVKKMGYKTRAIRDENGVDWMEARKNFNDGTLKIGYDDSGMIRTMHLDVMLIWPENLHITEVHLSEIPEGFPNRVGPWMKWWPYIDGKITHIEGEEVETATKKRDKLIQGVRDRITHLQEAEEDGDITDDEKNELVALRGYRTALRRLDLSTAPEIDWPANPLTK